MKKLAMSLAVTAAMFALSGCQPDQEYRVARACRESVTFIMAPGDNALEESCSCMAKAAVAQLDHDTVEYMISMLEDQGNAFHNPTSERMAKMQKVVDFQMRNDACFKPLISRDL